MGYWKELPFRGEPPDKTPKPRKPKRTPKEKRRDNIISVFLAIPFLAFIFCFFYFDPTHPQDEKWKFALFLLAIFILMIGMSAGIDAMNKYLWGKKRGNSTHPDKEKPGTNDGG